MPTGSFVTSPDGGGEEGDTTGSVVPVPVDDVGAPTHASSSSLSQPLPPSPLVPNTDGESKPASTAVQDEVRHYVAFLLLFFQSFCNV